MLAADMPMVERDPTTPTALVRKVPDVVIEFESIYTKYFDFVWRSVLRLGVEEALAEDVVQEVFVIVHRRLDSFESRSSLKTWVFGVTRGVVRNHRRSRKRQRDGHKEIEQQPPGDAPARPDDTLAKRQAQRVLYAILDELDDARREVFILAELEQMPVVEIAEALDTNLNTIYSRLRQARLRFHKAAERHRARDDWRV